MSTMGMRRLGQGPEVAVIGLGGNNFGRQGTATATQEGADAVLDAALAAGITLVDTAELYQGGVSEELIGNWLASRGHVVQIATKFGNRNGGGPGSEEWGNPGSAGYVRKACDASLKRLRIEAIDLYQQHTPDPHTPIEETLGALDELVKAGKVKAIGHSNFSSVQMRSADRVARERGLTPFVSAQNNYSLVEREIERADLGAINDLGLGLLPFFPLASGLLTGKYSAGARPEGGRLSGRDDVLAKVDWQRLDAYAELCRRAGRSMLEVSIGWLLAQPGVTCVIAGATTPDQVRANAAAGREVLDDDLVEQVSALFA
ncbi:aldo/keto reductase [Aestuariimicrobium ganziense]|uniref:aldo/keto reductase n=1 Tax=Aestuariimicrobium ganziense TaxID=2773677 RepID=UPI0019438295|nr:aldo/keto reductase [Aestuariimicrobium ganziense]